MWLFLFYLLSNSVSGEVCRALSLSGGGSRGCYEVGALWALVNNLPADEVSWDVISGISTGSLNTAGMSMFPKGKEVDAMELLKNVWLNITGPDNIFVEWPEGVVFSLLTRPSLFDTTPLRNLVSKVLTEPIARKIVVGTTSLNTGAFVNYNETVGRDLVEAVMCSTAVPTVFPYQKFDNNIYADGGCVINQDVFSAINRCYEQTGNEADIIVDLVFCGSASKLSESTSTMKTLDVMGRVNNIQSYDSDVWYLYYAMTAYPEVNFRYILFPSKSIPGELIPLDFKPASLKAGFDVGVNDGLNAIRNSQVLKEDIDDRINNLFKITPVS